MVVPGLDRVLLDLGVLPHWARPPARLGLLTSDAIRPVLSGRRSSARAGLLKVGVRITRLFTPEHGLSAAGADGVRQPHGRDPETGLPVVSLYGDHLAPTPESLRDLQGVLVDLQDVGARFYTFLWTVSHLLESCARVGIPVAVLDRPNPLGGEMARVEGPLPDPDLRPDFLCRWPVPIRHSLTLAELATWLRHEMGLEVEVASVPMEGWTRAMTWPETGLPFRPPSPGLPEVQSVFLYPALAFMEGSNVSVGRGTPLSFRSLQAPWLDGRQTARELDRLDIAGLRVSPMTRSGDTGVELAVTDPSIFRPVAAGLRLLALMGTLYPSAFRRQPYPTAVNPTGARHLLRLLRSRSVLEALSRRPEECVSEEFARRATRAPGWPDRVRPHLLYA